MTAYTPSEYLSECSTRAGATASAANILTAGAAAAFAIYAAYLYDSMRMEHKASSMQLDIGRRQQDRIRGFWPYEIKHLEEWANKPEPEAPATLGSRYAGRMLSGVAARHMENIAKTREGVSRYCTSANERAMQGAYIAQAIDETQARVEGYNTGFSEHNDRRVVRFKRWLDAVTVGTGAIDNALSFIQQGQAGRNQMAGVAMNNIADALNTMKAHQSTPIAGTSPQEWYGALSQTGQAANNMNYGIASGSNAMTQGSISNPGAYKVPDNDTRWNSDTTINNSGAGTSPGQMETPNTADGISYQDKGYWGVLPWPVPFGVCMVTLERYPQIWQTVWIDRMIAIRAL